MSDDIIRFQAHDTPVRLYLNGILIGSSMKLKPCPRCGADLEYHREDLSEEAIAADVQPDEWVGCPKCDYVCTLEFYPETPDQLR